LDSSSSIEFVHGIQHGNDVLHWSCRLDVMNGVENESPARREDLASAQYLFPDFGGRSEGKNLLRVHPSTPENQAVSKVGFELLGVHSGRGALHGIQDVDSALDEGRKKL
jgi:hypothetical protein